MSSTESIRGSLDDDGTRGMGLDVLLGSYLVYCVYFLMDLGPVQMALARVFTTSGDKSSGSGVSQCAESAERPLIEHSLVVGLIKLCGGVRTGFVSFCWVSLLI
jgi:hypothetical protein